MSAATSEPTPTPALVAAREFVRRGWRPFPLDHPSLSRCAGSGRRCRENREARGDCAADKRGKHPVNVWSTQTASPPTDGMLELWFGGEPRNVGIAAGPSGLLVVDEDELDALTRAADELGEALPDTYRVMTARGWHWYFADPENEFGNGPGALADYGCDVRGGNGAGGYVVAAGSTHHTGVEYVAADSAAEVAPLPDWVKTLLRTPTASKGQDAGQNDAHNPGGPGQDGWTDQPRYGYAADLRAQFARHLAAVEDLTPPPGRAPNGGEFRHRLFLAALDGWRLVDVGLLDEFSMLDQVRDAIVQVWRADPDDDDRRIVYTEAREKASASPWRVLDPPASTSDDSPPGADEFDPFELAVQVELRKLKVTEEARRRHASERRADRPRIADGVLDDLDAIEPPEMLMGALIPEGAVGFLAGRSGAYKSFLAVAWACCIATGRPWLGDDRFRVRRPLRTLYVAAEGSSGAAGRIRAWEAANGTSRRGKLLLYPRPIHLNDPAQAVELAEYVAEHGIEFLVVDTYHRSAPGTEENSATDFGAVFEAVARLRDEHGCAVLFVDHTGASKTGNPRGTSAKRDDADYVLSSSYLGEEATADAQRELFVTKLKDEDTSGRWPIRLVRVEGQSFPVVEIGATETVSPLGGLSDDWNDPMQAELPADVAGYSGRGSAAIRPLARFMRARATGGVGFTMAAARKAVLARHPDRFSADTVDRAWGALYDLGRIEVADTGSAIGRSLWQARPGDPE